MFLQITLMDLDANREAEECQMCVQEVLFSWSSSELDHSQPGSERLSESATFTNLPHRSPAEL